MRNPLLYALSLIVSSSLYAQTITCTLDELKGEFLLSPQKSGSTYYAYPGPMQSHYTPAPVGYSPVYISHYGRHGSRWVTSDSRYLYVIGLLDTHELTDLGKSFRKSLELVWQDAQGRGGDLTPVGECQHHDIAQRMFHNYSTIFTDSAHIRAYASTSRRCMMSMFSFCEGLKELNVSLHITRSAHERDMSFINYESSEFKAFTSDTSQWAKEYVEIQSQYVSPKRFVSSLFLHPDEISSPMHFMEEVYWIVQNQQDTELNLNLYNVFTPDELFGIWSFTNYRMYVTSGGSPTNKGIPAACANNLLDNIIQCADIALSDRHDVATLRFGHDSALIKLLTLMKINEANAMVDNIDEVSLHWQDFRISPMAANLQMIFYRGENDNILVKFLLNENEVTLPIKPFSGPYYQWNDVKRFWGR